MAFDWKTLAERADPRKWNWSWIAPARDWAVTNRTTVLATSIALLVGLWGGAVLENASRAGLPQVDGMAFLRLRAEMNRPEPRACLEFSQNLSTDQSVNFADYISLEPAAPFQVDVSGNLLCLGGLPLEPERQVTIREGLPSQTGERTEYDLR
jgi:alpha-2-macroglobulin